MTGEAGPGIRSWDLRRDAGRGGMQAGEMLHSAEGKTAMPYDASSPLALHGFQR